MPEPLAKLSLLIPAYNEEGSLRELHGELQQVLGALGRPYEILFVDDGSTDSTPQVLAGIAAADPMVRVHRMKRNSGKSAAYMAGFGLIDGSVFIMLDADLQDNPHEIPRMLAAVEGGTDLVVGWKKGRLENEPLKKIPSTVFNGLATRLFRLTLHDANCGFKAMRRDVAMSFDLYGDLYRFIPQLAHTQGFRVGEIAVNHRKRKHGYSKYGARRFWTGLLDLISVRFITRHSNAPLHFFGTVGLVPILAGLLLEAYVLAMKLAGGTFQTHVAAIVVGVLLLIVGFQSIITGLIGEMLTAQARRRA